MDTLPNNNATPESVWELQQQHIRNMLEFDRGMEELRKLQEKTERMFQENAVEHKKTEQMFQETDRMFQENAIEHKKTEQMLQENAIEHKKTEQMFQETDRKLKHVGQLLSGISDNNGAIAEEFFFNVLSRKMEFGGVKYDHIFSNVKGRHRKEQGEFDVVMFNGTAAAIIEVKHCAHPNDVDDLIDKKINSFKILFPKYADHKIYLGIASFAVNNAVAKHAKELGIGILKQNGDTIEYDTENMKAY